MSAKHEVGRCTTAARLPTSTTDAHISVKLSGSRLVSVQKPFLTFVETVGPFVSSSSTLHTLSDQNSAWLKKCFMALVGGSAGPLLKMSGYTSGSFHIDVFATSARRTVLQLSTTTLLIRSYEGIGQNLCTMCQLRRERQIRLTGLLSLRYKG